MRMIFAVAALISLSWPAVAAEESFPYAGFGKVTVYRGEGEPKEVVLFVSGDGGWNQGVVDMARSLAALDTLVVGIDIIAYLKSAAGTTEKCTYAAGDLERLSQFVQKKYGIKQYRVPVLVGYSSGATLVYAALVQAPVGPFSGGISLGFCPDLKTAKPLCKGRDLAWSSNAKLGAIYKPSSVLETPWTALHGDIDQVCDLAQARAFVEQVPNGKLTVLPKVGHGFSVQKNWMPQFKTAFTEITERDSGGAVPVAAEVGDLPLVEVPTGSEEGQSLAILLTGDGGWAGLDREIGATLAKRGVPVVGFNSLGYFWTKRSPEEAAADLQRVITHYTAAWKKSRITLIGYSFGADVLPFIVRRLPPEMRSQIDKVVLLALSDSAVFEFSIGDWIGSHRADAVPVLPEVEALQSVPLLCVYGIEETDSLCKKLPEAPGRSVLETKGGHHFGGDVGPIVEAILKP